MKRHLPSLAAIRAFEAAARHGSMQSAAEELKLTPSAISHQVKALESFTGTALFERAPGRLSLTKEGSDFFKDLRHSLDLLETAIARVTRSSQTDHVTIHMFHSLSELWFTPLLAEFHRDHPQITISVVSDPIAADFGTGIADIAVVYQAVPEWGSDNFLMADQIVPCCSREFLRQHGPIRSAEAIQDLPLIWCDAAPDDWSEWFKYVGVKESRVDRWICFDLQAAALQAAREGLGIAIGHTPYLETKNGRQELVQPLNIIAPTGFGYGVSIAQRAVHLKSVNLFVSWLKRASRALKQGGKNTGS